MSVRVCVCLSVCALDSMEGAAEPSHPLRALRVCLCAGNAQQQSALQENDTIRLRRLPGCQAALPTAHRTPTILAFCLAVSNSSLLAGGERHVMADECRCRELALECRIVATLGWGIEGVPLLTLLVLTLDADPDATRPAAAASGPAACASPAQRS